MKENATFQTFWDSPEAGLRGKLRTLHGSSQKEELSQINNVAFLSKKLEKKSKINPKEEEEKNQ